MGIKGENLEKLGFEKTSVPAEENDGVNPYDYYTYEVNENCILITNASDETIDGSYEVEFFNNSSLSTSNIEKLEKLVEAIEGLK